MKKILFLTVLLSASTAFAEDGKNDWHDTTLSDATIKKIQAAQYQYKKCVSAEMQKFAQQELDSRRATDVIMKQCESVLSQMREVYLAEKVPETIADRHLKQMRIQTTRNVLQGMIFSEAARKSGQQ
jgi:transposase